MELERLRVRRNRALVNSGRSTGHASHDSGSVAVSRALEPVTSRGGLASGDFLRLQGALGNKAVQRLVASDGTMRGAAGNLPIQRKLNWQGTKWPSAKFLDASSGGGGGVLFAGEKGYEVVVKPGEDMASESAMAALLHNEVGQSSKHKLVTAPGTRIVEAKERAQIKTALLPLVPGAGANAPDVKGPKGKAAKNQRAQGLVGMLDQPGVIVQDIAVGQEFGDAVGKATKTDPGKKHTEKKLFGGRKLRKDSPLRIFKDVRSIEALGMTTAVDLFTGNKDRLFMFNKENFFVTPYSLTMIDNIWMGTDMSYFQTTKINDDFTITVDSAMQVWKSDPEVKALAANNYGPISNRIWDMIIQSAASSTRKIDSGSFKDVMAPYESRFKTTFTKGLIAGKKSLVASLSGLLKDPSKLQQLAPGVDLTQILATMKKRKDFLEGNNI